jgi:formylglycine-generating enzyme required for sulfatase activity
MQTLISKSVQEQLAGTPIICRPLGAMHLEGKSQAEQIWEIIWTDLETYDLLRTSLSSVATADMRDDTPPQHPSGQELFRMKWADISIPWPTLPGSAWAAIGVLLVTTAMAAGIARVWSRAAIEKTVQASFQLPADSATSEMTDAEFLEKIRLEALTGNMIPREQGGTPQPGLPAAAALADHSPGFAKPPAPPDATVASLRAVPQQKWSSFFDTVAIPGGVFMMGNDSGDGDEKPAHQVRVDPFHMSRTEITNRQYMAFLDDTGYQRPKDPGFAKNYLLAWPDLPVVNVSYNDAVEFCAWASARFNAAIRLPTEAEWEYAARAGSSDSATLYAWGSEDPMHMARYKANAGRDVATVTRDTFPANAFGLFHMSGNVSEWVLDYYARDYYITSPIRNPAGPATGSKRVVRGGSWDEGVDELRTSHRANRDPADRRSEIGFRVVVKLPLE